MQTVLERFLRYVKIDTQSAEDMEAVPSTEKQFNLARLLEKELKEIGAEEVRLSENAYVYAKIPASADAADAPKLGFIAHMDTSDAVSGENVNPRLVENYDGKDVILNKELDVILSPAEFPDLLKRKGETLVVTDGTTLLGADDKAGVAAIMTAAEYLLTNKEVKHGEIRIAFTPDEEVGRGTDFFDIKGFDADYAYTIDGGVPGEIEYECFNAAAARVSIKGVSVHPGSSKNMMKNALTMGMRFNGMLPVNEVPEFTEGYEGFYHLTDMAGGCDSAVMKYILRDHDEKKLEERKEYLKKTADYLNGVYGEGTFTVEIKDQYKNMKQKIEPFMFLIDNAKEAMLKAGMEPIVVPIRGGTDGARLSYEGLPCPNLCTGGANFHGKYEYITVEAMEKVVKMLLNLMTR